MLRRLIEEHPGPSHIFYLDVPLEETVRRHERRPTVTVASDKVREWYHHLDLLRVPGEITIDGRPGVSETLSMVLDHLGPVAPPQCDLDAARFL
jgi:hypothetical protein